MGKTIHQSFAVPFDYPVVFTRGVFRPANPALVEVLLRREAHRLHRAAVFVDAGVEYAVRDAHAYLDAQRERVERAGDIRVLPGGEAVKNSTGLIEQLVEELVALRLDRQSFVIAVGGGAVLDAVGFAASLVHRGLRMVRIPTTVLAQNDAGIGVKNAVNFNGAKNLIGTFAPPFAVINDLDFLGTLPDAAWTDGIAEAFKVALIKDADFFRELCDSAESLRKRDAAAMEHLVVRCAELHLEHIRSSGDPFEMGRARPLDFGHWSAHKLEVLSDYRISHGRAVAIGLALDAGYARQKGWISGDEYRAICDGLTAAGFVLWHPLLDRANEHGQPAVLDGLRDFQEHLGGELCVTMPMGLGQKIEANEIDRDLMARSISLLKDAYSVPTPTAPDLLPECPPRRTVG